METLPAIIEEKKSELVSKAKSYLQLKATNKTLSVKIGFAFQEVKGYLKDLEELRLSLTRPLDAQKADIMAAFKKPKDALEAVAKHLEGEIKIWAHVERKRAEEEQRRLDEEIKKAEAERKENLLNEAQKKEEEWDFLGAKVLEEKAAEVRAATPILPEPKLYVRGVRETVRYCYRIVNADAIPREFWVVNEKLLGELARSTKGKATIPGVEFFEEKGIAPTGR